MGSRVIRRGPAPGAPPTGNGVGFDQPNLQHPRHIQKLETPYRGGTARRGWIENVRWASVHQRARGNMSMRCDDRMLV